MSEQRTDDQIREEILAALGTTDIEVTVSGGTVRLSGTADDRAARRRAETAAQVVAGVVEVENNIQLADDRPPAQEGTDGSEGGGGD
jgi:osmotically-inducible protein OsmY